MAATISIVDFELPDVTHNEYTVQFYNDSIHTLVTHDPSKVTEWISTTESIHATRLRRLIVGLDVEWRPNNRYHENPVATLQLCVGRRCLIFQLLYCPRGQIPQKLLNFLNNPHYTFVGVGVENDVEKLLEDYDMRVANAVDLGVLAADLYGDRGLKNAGLKGLSRVLLGKEIKKPKWVTRSRWDQEYLTPNQVQYACLDAFVSFQIGRRLNAFNQVRVLNHST